MNLYLIIFNDGKVLRIEEIWFNQYAATRSLKNKGDPYQIIEFETMDSPPQTDNGLNHIREIVLEDYEIE